MRKSDAKIEKMLFVVYLDLAFSVDLAGDHVESLQEDLKLAKQSLKKANKLKKKAVDKFTELTGEPPMHHRKKNCKILLKS